MGGLREKSGREFAPRRIAGTRQTAFLRSVMAKPMGVVRGLVEKLYCDCRPTYWRLVSKCAIAKECRAVHRERKEPVGDRLFSCSPNSSPTHCSVAGSVELGELGTPPSRITGFSRSVSSAVMALVLPSAQGLAHPQWRDEQSRCCCAACFVSHRHKRSSRRA